MNPDVEAYLEWCNAVRRLAPTTTKSYASTLRQWSKWWGSVDAPAGAADATDVDHEPALADLETFCNRTRHKGQPSSVGAIARDVVALKSYWKWRVRVGLSGKDVAGDLLTPKRHIPLPRALDDDTWVTLWTSPHVTLQDRSWLGLGFFCGLRRAEITALRGHQLNVPARRLESFVRKGGGDHVLAIGPILDVYERKLPHLRADLFWPALEAARTGDAPLCGLGEYQQLAKRLDRLIGWADVKRFTPHALRHSAVTNLLRAQVPLHLVSKLMNHTSMTTTMRYVRAGGDELGEWLNSSNSHP